MKCHNFFTTGIFFAALFCTLALTTTGNAATIAHYWDMDTLSGGVPTDLVGGVTTTAVGTPVMENASYGPAYTGSGNYLKLVKQDGNYLVADVYDGAATALIFGTDDFSFSYWSYDDKSGDGDPRGPRVFDFNGSGAGIHVSAGNATPSILNISIKDTSVNFVKSKDTLAIAQAVNTWTHVAVNVIRSTDTTEVYFDGVSQGTFDISLITDNIEPSQDLDIGVIDGGATAGKSQSSGLDDLAFYTGTLTQTEVEGLADGTLTPVNIPEPGSFALAVMALSAFGLVVRRRQRR